MDKKYIDKYDFLTVSEVESDIRKNEIGVAFIVTAFVLFLALFFFYVNSSDVIPVLVSDIKNESVGETRYSVNISAYVPSFLGVKKIGDQWRNKMLLVFGNSNYGFSVADLKTKDTFFQYEKMPGDGIMINLSREIENFTFDSKF